MSREERIEAAVEAAMAPLKDGFQMHDIWDMVTNIMENAEEWVGLTSGKDKKEFALEVIDIVLQNDAIDLPGPDFITRRVIMWFMPGLIDKFVDIAKKVPNFGAEEAA